MSRNLEDLTTMMKLDLIHLVCGNLVGSGTRRQVYIFKPDPKYVIKIDYSLYFDNAVEWDLWQNVVGTKMEKWFAPCLAISSYGTWLIQRRTKPIIHLPKRVPAMLGDHKRENWGMLDGRPVMHDYANHRGTTLAIRNASKLIEADWHTGQKDTTKISKSSS